jgi:hypothetical protein
MAKLVRVQIRHPASHGDTSVVVLRWDAAGAAANLFAVLDADLTVSPAGDGSAFLRLDGIYRPQLGALGAGLGSGSPAPCRRGNSTRLRPPGRRHSDQPAGGDRGLAGRPCPDPAPDTAATAQRR